MTEFNWWDSWAAHAAEVVASSARCAALYTASKTDEDAWDVAAAGDAAFEKARINRDARDAEEKES